MEHDLDFGGRTVVVTGAAGKLGSAMSRGFAAKGATVVLVDRDAEGLESLARELGSPHPTVAVDLTTQEAPERIVGAALDATGRIDVLINNAGSNPRTDPLRLTPEIWETVFSTNLRSAFFLTQAVGRVMVEARSGAVVNISSICGSSGMGRGNLAFSAAKAGLEQLTRELTLEWGPYGIRVNGIAPSQIESPRMRDWMRNSDAAGAGLTAKLESAVPLGRLVTPEDVVGPALFLASDSAAMVSGTMLAVDGGNMAANLASTIGPVRVG